MIPRRGQERLRSAAASGARKLLRRVDPGALAVEHPPAPVPVEEATAALPPPAPGVLGAERNPVTALLRARLSPQEVAAVEWRISAHPELEQAYHGTSPEDRDRALLSLGIFLLVAEVGASTGLGMEQPPDEVHAMARGPFAAAGGLYEADLVADALASVGVEIASKRSALDFGCSSGRVVRALAAAHPDVAWHGCDPNAMAIAWAREAIPHIRFFRSSDNPPLDLPDDSLDLVYAISIWSHFAPVLGLAWLEEMERLLRPGGHLVMTTHGNATVAHDDERGLRDRAQLERIEVALARHGAWYAAEFGEIGDWGVSNREWGTAFLSAEWLLAHLTPRWRLLQLAPGRLHGNQDVYVLERV